MTAYSLDPRSRRRISRIAPAVVATLLLLLVLAAFFLAPPASGAEAEASAPQAAIATHERVHGATQSVGLSHPLCPQA